MSVPSAPTTEHDLLRWQLETARTRAGQSPAEATIPELLSAAPASAAMSRLVVSVEDPLPLMSAVPILLELPYRRLPVTRHGRPVGILSRADVLKALAEQDLAGIESTAAGSRDMTWPAPSQPGRQVPSTSRRLLAIRALRRAAMPCRWCQALEWAATPSPAAR
jgi:CBS domain-containing protein